MGKQHFLQQAHTYKAGKHKLVGRMATVKLDGIRCFWDGGVTREMLKSNVPWANCAKDSRYKEEQYATGLWTRYGNVVNAPDWFLDELPEGIPLDGELWAGRGRHQFTRSVVSRLKPDARWRDIRLGVFNSPTLKEIFFPRTIELKNQYEKDFSGVLEWLNLHCVTDHKGMKMTYKETQDWLQTRSFWSAYVEYVNPVTMCTEAQVEDFYNRELALGGEGVIFTEPDSYYKCERVHSQVKVKPFETEEATVIGYITGRKTELGSKLLGKMGAMVVRMDNGIEFELSGFTAQERTLISTKETYPAYEWACEYPETRCPEWISALYFPRGTRISFKYRELSDDGVPKEARYYRKREIE
jgi:DNA ligase-1